MYISSKDNRHCNSTYDYEDVIVWKLQCKKPWGGSVRVARTGVMRNWIVSSGRWLTCSTSVMAAWQRGGRLDVWCQQHVSLPFSLPWWCIGPWCFSAEDLLHRPDHALQSDLQIDEAEGNQTVMEVVSTLSIKDTELDSCLWVQLVRSVKSYNKLR